MIPGLPQELLQGSDEEGSMRMKRMIYITDSMSSAELDSDGSLFMEMGKDGKPVGLTWRVTRVAKGSGTSVREVEELLCQYRMMANMAKQAGGKNGWYGSDHRLKSDWLSDSSAGYKRCRRCRAQQGGVGVEPTACLPLHRFKRCK
jgi:signal recognition particle subunit SRP54